MMVHVTKWVCVLAASWGVGLAHAATDEQLKQVPRLVKLLVPFSAGASNDAIARAMAPALAKRLKTTVIVENKPGAAGAIGADAVAKSRPDGSMLLLTSSTFLTAAVTQSRLTYDPVQSFAPVAMVGQGPMLVAVSSALGLHTPAAFVAAARSKPGAMTYGSAGNGSIAHLATEMLSDGAQVQLTHIPYKGAANALLDMASGQIDMMVSNYSSLAPQIASGRVKALAVTSSAPSPAFPDLPAMADAAPGFAADIWISILAPAATPTALVQLLNQEINAVAREKEVLSLLEMDGAVPTNLTPDEVKQRIQADLQLWKKIAVEKKIQND